MQDLGRMCRYTYEEDPTELPYALVGHKLADGLTLAAEKKYSVFHGLYVEGGGNLLDYQCIGRSGMYKIV